MIKFFKKIRYDLMEKNKTGKYLKYAIGEIILVVIGILIALSINNWNEYKKEVSRSRSFLKEFRKDLVSDTVSFNEGITFLEAKIKNEKWALNRTNYSVSDLDSLLLLLNETYVFRSLNLRTFNMVQNSGNSKLTGYDSLFDKLSTYYGKTNEKLNTYTTWDQRIVTEDHDYLSVFHDLIETDNENIRNAAQLDEAPSFPMTSYPAEHLGTIIAFFTSTRGRNYLKENYTRHIILQGIYLKVINEATALISLIDNVLEESLD